MPFRTRRQQFQPRCNLGNPSFGHLRSQTVSWPGSPRVCTNEDHMVFLSRCILDPILGISVGTSFSTETGVTHTRFGHSSELIGSEQRQRCQGPVQSLGHLLSISCCITSQFSSFVDASFHGLHITISTHPSRDWMASLIWDLKLMKALFQLCLFSSFFNVPSVRLSR
jgi:hypothetical protein